MQSMHFDESNLLEWHRAIGRQRLQVQFTRITGRCLASAGVHDTSVHFVMVSPGMQLCEAGMVQQLIELCKTHVRILTGVQPLSQILDLVADCVHAQK